jgi:hypothetical protein
MNASKRRIVMAALMIVSAAGATGTLACGRYGDHAAATAVLSDDPAVANAAIETLRCEGATGLAALLAAHQELIDAKDRGEIAPTYPKWVRLEAAIDAVGGQKDCRTSKLFWHTDLEAAKAESARSGKPILSLRLLGKLTDELSCANSRFFRSTLYANTEVGTMLREKFVLHWQSVRPVPVVTVDFGDGRVLSRTLTGNSIHYVLDAEGRVLDALPGLYGPAAFLRGLGEAASLADTVRSATDADRESTLRQYHEQHARVLADRLQDDLKALRMDQGLAAAAPIDDATWNKIAELHRADASLDPASIEFIRRQQQAPLVALRVQPLPAGMVINGAALRPVAWAKPAEFAGQVAIGKGIVEDPILRLVRSFESSIALDTVRNEFLLHRTIHEWLAAGDVPPVDALNARVYAELFLTPDSDPWLGLAPRDTYTALEHGGVVIQ